MKAISILDCTLRDGGYINDWNFGKDAIRFILNKLSSTKIEMIEVGFIKNTEFNPNRTVFPDVYSINSVISPKDPNVCYVGMVDMSAPIPLENIQKRSSESIDAIRVIFKQNRIDEGYEYVKAIQDRGYDAIVQLVSTNTYTDKEFIDVLEKFSEIKPKAIYIVDSLGVMKRKDFLRMVHIFDNHVDRSIAIGYHSHNNLQQARGNAESLVELGLMRDVIIDATVFGMGRGAGNLNMELFCDYMNEYCGKNYLIEPMLEIIDEYLNDIYQKTPWGYSLPYYLSASNGCHPNYAKYFAEKGTLTEKAFNELLKTISEEDKPVYSKDKAETYYLNFMEHFVEDKNVLSELGDEFLNNEILLIAPGCSIVDCKSEITDYVKEKNPIVISINFVCPDIKPDYVFSSNMRRYKDIYQCNDVKKIITSNIKDASSYDYMVNYSSYCNKDADISDNSGLMLLKLLQAIGVREVAIAGMDGYSDKKSNYCDYQLNDDFSNKLSIRNNMIRSELLRISNQIKIKFITPSYYDNQ